MFKTMRRDDMAAADAQAADAVTQAAAAEEPESAGLKGVVERLLKHGGHAPLCPCRSHGKAVCNCGWGDAEAEAKAALGVQ